MFHVLHRFWRWLLARLGYCGGAHFLAGAPSLPPPLTPEQEKVLLSRMAAGDAAARDDLITHNLRLVVYLAKKYESSGVPAEDMISIGTIGLIKAVNTFTPERSTFAFGDVKSFRLSSDFSAFTYWIVPSSALSTITTRMTKVLSGFPEQAEITAATIRIPTRRSANCPKKTAKTLFFFPSTSTFSPYCASRFAASSVVSPCSEVSIFFFTSSVEI